MSPVAGAGIIIAGLAGINPMEMAKRNAVPCIVATVVIMLFVTMIRLKCSCKTINS